MGMAATIPYYTVDDLEKFPEDGNRYELLDGVLLVTPGPEQEHQLVATRLALMLSLQLGEGARVVAPGVVVRAPRTQLQPDILVYPARWSSKAKWTDITEHWLAVEVFSPSSRIYDRDFKRAAYFALGVCEVWLVDCDAMQVEQCLAGCAPLVATDVLSWTLPDRASSVMVDLRELFRD